MLAKRDSRSYGQVGAMPCWAPDALPESRSRAIAAALEATARSHMPSRASRRPPRILPSAEITVDQRARQPVSCLRLWIACESPKTADAVRADSLFASPPNPLAAVSVRKVKAPRNWSRPCAVFGGLGVQGFQGFGRGEGAGTRPGRRGEEPAHWQPFQRCKTTATSCSVSVVSRLPAFISERRWSRST